MIKNAFYFITKVLFVLKIFNPKKAGGQFSPLPPPPPSLVFPKLCCLQGEALTFDITFFCKFIVIP